MSDTLDFRGEPKELAYQENIQRYLKARKEPFRPENEYWTLAHHNSREVLFLEEHLLLSRAQFHGVNDSPETVESCRAQFPGANFHLGDWCEVLDQLPICPRGGLVYLDTMVEPDGLRPVASSMAAKTLNRVGPGTVVCINLCAQSRFGMVPLDNFYSNLWEAVDRSQIAELGTNHPPRTHVLQMVTLFFAKQSARAFASMAMPGSRLCEEAPPKNPVKELFPWQQEFAEGIVSSWRSKVVAPTGSGKTLVMLGAAIGANDLGRKALIVVPQRHISQPFLSKEMVVGGRARKFRIERGHVFLGGRDSALEGNYSQRLASWLKSSTYPETAITSAATLVRLIPEMDKLPLDNVLFLQDEAHHISGVMADDEECSPEDAKALIEEGTHLGDFYEHILQNTQAGMCIVSATHFRGDKFPMFLEKASAAFKEYVRPWEDHWKWLGLESFNYDCVGYSESDVTQVVVDAILSERTQRHIVCVPADTHRFRKDNSNWVSEFVMALETAGLRTLDLVTVVGREDQKQKLFADNKAYDSGEPSQYDVVVACNMMREGTDWIPATRVHDLAPSPSLLRTTQTIGRLMRKDPNKRDVAYRAWFRNLDKNADKEEVREHVADRANVALATMVLAENFFGLSPSLDVGKSSGPSGESLAAQLNRVYGEEKLEVIKRLSASLEAHREDGKITDQTISRAILSMDRGHPTDPYAAVSLLQALAKKQRTLEENAVSKISPSLQLLGTGLDPSLLRESGFDYTVRSFGLLSFETATSHRHYAHLREVATPLQGDQAQKAALNKKVLGDTPLTKAEKVRSRKAKTKFPQLATSHSSSVSRKIEN